MRKLGWALVAALVASLLLPVSARAARTVVVAGGGWGHGIGMSQYGAYGRALKGYSARQILRHYYTGVTVQRRRMPKVRVGLLQGQTIIEVSSTGGDVVFKVAGSAGRIVRGGPDDRFRLEPSPTGGVRIYRNGRRIYRNGRGVFGSPGRPVIALYERLGSKVHVFDKGIAYAYGRLEFGTYSGCSGYCLRLVLPLTMQKYLYGLGEVPSSWPQAVLRVQAVAGRTYAFKKAKDSGHHRIGCDCTVYDSTLDQAYIGDAKRTGSGIYWDDWKNAVKATNRDVILYRGAPILALYSSSSGGHTENNENVWGGVAIPYLRGVRDKADAVSANPNHRWRLTMSWSALSSKLDNAYNTGALQRFKLVKPFGVSGRVTVVKPGGGGGVRIVGSRRTVRADGYEIRSVLGLKDTLFRVKVTYEIHDRLIAKYRRLGGAPGDPIGDSHLVPRRVTRKLGRAQDFQRGRLTYVRATGRTHWQYGRVMRRYDSLGRERSQLGMPRSDVFGDGFRRANYARGLIASSSATGAHAVAGRFADAYKGVGALKGPLGLPLAEDAAHAELPGGRRQRFQTGTLYRDPGGRVHGLWGEIDAAYRRRDQAIGPCGYPTSDVQRNADGSRHATFEGGSITWTPDQGIRVDCK